MRVSVVQWIEQIPPKNQIWVRFPVGTPNTPQAIASSDKKPVKFLELAGFFLLFMPKLAYWKQEK